MRLSSHIKLAHLAKAEKLWEKGKFKEASQSYYDAANYAANKLHDIPLSKKIYVEYYLSLISEQNNYSNQAVENLIKAMDDLIKHGLDDRLELKLNPYIDFFKIIIFCNNEDFAKLETVKMVLSDKLSEKTILAHESLILVLIELALAKSLFHQDKGNQKMLRKLSSELDIISDQSDLPLDLKRKIKEFSHQLFINFDDINPEKKKGLN